MNVTLSLGDLLAIAAIGRRRRDPPYQRHIMPAEAGHVCGSPCEAVRSIEMH